MTTSLPHMAPTEMSTLANVEFQIYFDVLVEDDIHSK